MAPLPKEQVTQRNTHSDVSITFDNRYDSPGEKLWLITADDTSESSTKAVASDQLDRQVLEDRIQTAGEDTYKKVIGQTYFVDAINGSDSNDGWSSVNAWKTIAKVNAASLNPGDRVMFRRGQTWAGTQLNITASGRLNAPIVIGTYGQGEKPIINGNSAVNGIYAIGRRYLYLQDIDLRNGLDHGAKFDNCEYVELFSCDSSGAGNDNIIFINGCRHGVVRGGAHNDAFRRVGSYFAAGIEIADGGEYFLIEDVTGTGNADAFITVHNHGASDPQGATNIPRYVTIRNAHGTGNDGHGLNVMVAGPSARADLLVESSTFNGNTLDGVRISRIGSAAGTSNITTGITFQDVEATNNSRYEFYGEVDDLTLRRVLLANGRGMRLVDCVGVDVEHLTSYLTTSGGYQPLAIDGARTNDFRFRNSILASADAACLLIVLTAAVNPAAKDIDIDYMLYGNASPNTLNRLQWSGTNYTFANWKSATGQDAHSPTPASPGFVNAAGNNFQLGVGSPAIDKGENLGETFLGFAPDLGYAEGA